ncbi:hypothetical protein OJAV_G00234910 [Oryzias javanicus]|uniref:C-type lectin domain-containing protein n=1 Tax=Oryzias javanicus TaxID=123683 RepID=A0A3S2NSZ7_ORYJA|nr:hypothetical protein OJAV_G00234910 [Oryzias javanicus]
MELFKYIQYFPAMGFFCFLYKALQTFTVFRHKHQPWRFHPRVSFYSLQSSIMMKILLFILVSSEIFILSSCLIIRQYHFSEQRMNWTEAQTFCRKTYTDLATIESAEEMGRVRNVVLSTGYQSDFWIGLRSDINWTWSDGYTGSLSYPQDYWTSEDSFHSRSDQICMTLDWQASSFTWSDERCDSLLPFVCNKGTKAAPVYVFVNNAMNWSSAQRYCRQNFTDLVTVQTATVWTNIRNAVSPNRISWIGLSRDSSLSWSDGSNFFFYQKPTDLSHWPGMISHTCGYQYVNDINRWYIHTCAYKFPVVCYELQEVKKRVVKLRLTASSSDILNNSTVKAELLEKLQGKLEENGVTGVELKWRQTDGDVFKKEEKIN